MRSFQSTRPLRGATEVALRLRQPADISIHAPLAGRDNRVRISPAAPKHFNPRAPCGARLVLWVRVPHSFISIHAPLAGRDSSPSRVAPVPFHFNPRAPCGARRLFCRPRYLYCDISIHAPLAGRDATWPAITARLQNFNPRAPCGARQQKRTKIFLRFCDNRQISADFSANHRLSKRFTSAFQKKRGRFPVRSSRQFSARLRFARDDHCHSERSITPSACRSRRTGDALRPR